MAQLSVYANTGDKRVRSSSSVYATARSATGANLMTDANGYAGQDLDTGTYYLFYPLIAFDLSALPDDCLITGATLSVKWISDSSAQDFTLQARAFDYGASVGTEDWVGGANLANYTLLATYNTANGVTPGSRVNLVSEAAFLSNISKTGLTKIALCSDRLVAGNTPAGHEFVEMYLGNNATQGNRPQLVVDYDDIHMMTPNRGVW